MKSKIATFAMMMLSMGVASSAFALGFEPDGTVTGWGVKPFTVAGPGTATHPNGVQSVYQNDYSPINYPGGVGHRPSPAGTTGEKFDLEEMHVRQTGSIVEMLLVRSSPFQASASSTFTLGDMLLDTNGDDLFDHGIVSTNAAAGLNAGGLYSITSTERLQNLSGSYRGHSLESTIGPWAIGSGTLLGETALDTGSYTYAGEGLTWLTVYTFDLTWLGALPTTIDYHLVWGCGNDVITGSFDVNPYTEDEPEEENQEHSGATPEPVTAALGLLSLAGITMGVRRRR